MDSIEYKTKPVLMLWSDLSEAVASEVKTTKGKLEQKLGCL